MLLGKALIEVIVIRVLSILFDEVSIFKALFEDSSLLGYAASLGNQILTF
jgi:hypothetical protein